jgi:hypothetical protein
MPYGLKKYPFPKYTGKLMPVSTAENPYAPGAPVMKLSPYAVLADAILPRCMRIL